MLLSFSRLKTHLLATKEINGYHSITRLNEIASYWLLLLQGLSHQIHCDKFSPEIRNMMPLQDIDGELKSGS